MRSLHTLLVCCCLWWVGAARCVDCDAMLDLSTETSSLSEGNEDIHRRSLSPWTWRMSTVPTRIPSTLWEAECSSSVCLFEDGKRETEQWTEDDSKGWTGGGTEGLSAVPIYQDVLVLQRDPGSGCFISSFRRVAVGCTCVRAVKVCPCRRMSIVSLSPPSLPAPLVTVLHKLLPSLPPTGRDVDVPPLYREAFVLSGYRPVGLSWRSYILSLFQIHNDSVKVWCHLLAALYVATHFLLFLVLQGGGVLGVQLQGPDGVGPSVDPCSLPLLLYVMSVVSCFSCGAAALLLHPRSEPVRLSLFLLDSAGRGLLQFGRALALSVYSSDADWTDSIMGQLYLPAAAVLSWLSCTAGCCAELFPRHRDLFHRRLLQTGPMSLAFLLDISPVAQRLYICPWSSSTAVLLHGLQVVLFLTAAFFLLCPVPECLSPGRFDIVGHSDQLSLVLLTLSTVSQQEALLWDFSWRRAGVVRRFGEEYLLKACTCFIAVTLSLSATALVLRRCGLLARSTT